MANINGTSIQDTIHMVGDGVPVFGNDITGTTDGADVVNAGAGGDAVYVYGGADSVLGGTGNDFIDGGTGNDTLDGGADNDTIYGGAGRDDILGGVGQDLVRIQQASDISGLAELIDGGIDYDILDFQTFGVTGAVDLSLATIVNVEELRISALDVTITAAALSGFGAIFGGGSVDRFILSAAGTVDLTDATILNIEEFRGTAGIDTFIFTNVTGNVAANGGGSNDTILGGNGSDVFNGGDGNDQTTGADGNDALLGGAGRDTLTGDDGNDTLQGGAGQDNGTGGLGNDTFRIAFVSEVSGQRETIAGGDDYDRIDFQALNAIGIVDLSRATISGVEELALSGNDVTLTAAQLGGFSLVTAGGFTDRIILSAPGNADLSGATFVNIDEIRGSAGADTINAVDAAGTLFITGRTGNDNISGGDGADRLWGDEGIDTLSGNDSNDTLLGAQDVDSLSGGFGYDRFQMQQISDISGLAETINGGADVDRLDFQDFTAVGAVDLSAATLSNLEELTLVNNAVTMTAAQMTMFDVFTGTGNAESLILAAVGIVDLTNAAITNIDEIRGTAGNDVFDLTGSSFNGRLNGLDGRDTVSGGASGEFIDGGTNRDSLGGGGGNDVLLGNVGTDTMTGGLGGDRFDFDSAADSGIGVNRDVIGDFVHGEDVVDLTDVDANSEALGNQQFTFGAFNGTAGRIVYAGGVLSADVNGDNVADFEIGFTGNPGVTASDILL